MSLPVLLTTEDVANYLKIDVVTVRRLVKRGELPAYRVGNEYRFTENDLMEFLERQRTPDVPLLPIMRMDLPLNMVADMLPMLRRQAGWWREEAGMGTNQLERFSQRARRVFTLAAEEAQKRGQAEINPVYLLLGVAQEEAGVGRRVLNELNVWSDKVSALLPAVASEAASVPQTLTPTTKQAIERAIQQARQLKHSHIGTEHLLLGLLADADIAQALAGWEITTEQVRAKIAEVLASPKPE